MACRCMGSGRDAEARLRALCLVGAAARPATGVQHAALSGANQVACLTFFSGTPLPLGHTDSLANFLFETFDRKSAREAAVGSSSTRGIALWKISCP